MSATDDWCAAADAEWSSASSATCTVLSRTVSPPEICRYGIVTHSFNKPPMGRDAKLALARHLLRRRGCLCVCHVIACVSVMLMCFAQTTESIIMQPSRDCSLAILVFPYQIWTRPLVEIPPLTASGGKGVGKSRKIRPINCSRSPKDRSWQHSSMAYTSVGRFVSDSWATLAVQLATA